MYPRMISIACAAAILCAAAAGCAPGRKYAWGNYDSTLYTHYRNPQEKEKNLERLKEIVTNAEKEDRVPPGLYAEYGYALYEMGNIPEAVANFEKEKAKWPESKVLMDKMIRNAGRRQENLKKSSAAAQPGEREATR